MKIIVNGTAVNVEGASISYEALVGLAGERGNPSVTYRSRPNGDSRREGTMHHGQTITIDPEMVFNVMHTNRA